MEKIISFFTTHHETLAPYLMWSIFGIIVITLLFLDLFVFHRHSEEPKFSETLKLSAYYIIIALIFGLFVIYEKGPRREALLHGYLVEKSLSMDNIFVISLVFSSLNVPARHQHRVLFWGVLGAIVMRAVMILIGAQLVSRFHGILYLFSFFLIYTGIKMVIAKEKDSPLTESRMYRFICQKFNVTKRLHGEHFFVSRGKRLYHPVVFCPAHH